mmetsp:Transcript_21890/g.38740  ORF Transcript_21890/g.38740 Transcript_21890/m.38740 type:complete len:135 (-) Transcript_21890:145-549(-)|eukprot:CAMPEP_0115079888 /NCGR_PEP_ID=MMETSP0227-20121206/18362_1 /TAXON_ID=89957 /ORGANISM="Polarella glacialis, Strain CCMP 1383" /LENGTH=134 /DNA_ID=CAMNT_0002467449 /DNA_START=1028 /DNA_END=1432 /DNA_ORIENTATION=+
MDRRAGPLLLENATAAMVAAAAAEPNAKSVVEIHGSTRAGAVRTGGRVAIELLEPPLERNPQPKPPHRKKTGAPQKNAPASSAVVGRPTAVGCGLTFELIFTSSSQSRHESFTPEAFVEAVLPPISIHRRSAAG